MNITERKAIQEEHIPVDHICALGLSL